MKTTNNHQQAHTYKCTSNLSASKQTHTRNTSSRDVIRTVLSDRTRWHFFHFLSALRALCLISYTWMGASLPPYIYIFDGRERTHFDAPGFSWNYHSIYILVCVHNYAPRCWLMGNYTTWLCEATKGAFAWDKPTISESGKVILLGDNQRFYTGCCGRRIIDRNVQEFL